MKIRNTIKSIIQSENSFINENDKVKDVLDMVDLLEIVIQIQEKYNISINHDSKEIAEANKISDLIGNIEKQINK